MPLLYNILTSYTVVADDVTRGYAECLIGISPRPVKVHLYTFFGRNTTTQFLTVSLCIKPSRLKDDYISIKDVRNCPGELATLDRDITLDGITDLLIRVWRPVLGDNIAYGASWEVLH